MSRKPTATALDTILERIALQHLRIETLQTRNSDRLDFYDVGVGSLKDALRAAFEVGQNTGYWEASNKPSNQQGKPA